MSSFLLILKAFSWFLLEQLLGLAVVCALINSYHADGLCASHSDGCKQFLGYFMQCGWGPVLREVKRTKAGLPAPHSPAEGRHWPPDLAGPGAPHSHNNRTLHDVSSTWCDSYLGKFVSDDYTSKGPSYTVGGHVNWYSFYGEQYGGGAFQT